LRRLWIPIVAVACSLLGGSLVIASDSNVPLGAVVILCGILGLPWSAVLLLVYLPAVMSADPKIPNTDLRMVVVIGIPLIINAGLLLYRYHGRQRSTDHELVRAQHRTIRS